jgi:Flp pilus assembly protein TadG
MHHADSAGREGQSLVEFSALATALLILVLGTLEFGRAFYYYSAIVNAAQEGARYGTTTGVNTAAKRTAIINTALQSAIAVGTETLIVTVSCSDCATATTGDQFTVTVNYTFTAVTLFVPSFPLSGRASMMIDHSP